MVTQAREIQVKGVGLDFEPDSLRVRTGERIRLIFDGPGHTLTIDELKLDLRGGLQEPIVGGFIAPPPGIYAYYCAISGHRSSGMEGKPLVDP
jgi:plastocyanin